MNNPLPLDPDTLGRIVRKAWSQVASQHPEPPPSWLAQYEDLNDREKEMHREVGEAVARHVLALVAVGAHNMSVLQAWVTAIPRMQQTVLLTAVRGPDNHPKYGGGAKMLLRWYRRCVLLSAMDGRALMDPIEPNGGSFTGPSLDGDDEEDCWEDRMQVHVNDYLRQLDALPHHWQMHFMHAVEIVGYKHPDVRIRHFWHQVYLRLVHDMHVWPETEAQLDDRLGDSRSGWLKRADPATVA